jgi:asparagine synthetase B (glutamine-hydrolysing)
VDRAPLAVAAEPPVALLEGLDAGPRFLAPRDRPTAVGARAADVAAAVGLRFALDRGTALGVVAFNEYDVERSLLDGIATAVPRVPLRRGGDGVLARGVARGPWRRRESDAEAARDLREALGEAVADAVRPARRPGILLSGGLDSSAIAAAAVAAWRSMGRPPEAVRLWHWLPPSGPTERDHAEAVARHLGLSLNVLRDAGGDAFEGTEACLRLNDMPADGGGIAPLLRGLVALRDDGVDVVLAGDGGDEAVTRDYVRPWRRTNPFRTAWALAGHVGRATAGRAAHRLANERSSLRRRARERGVPDWLASRLEGAPLPRPFPPARRGLSGSSAERDRGLRGARQTLIVSCQRAAAASLGLRTEEPFLDARVVDAVVAAPPRAFLGGRLDKGLLRRAFAAELPLGAIERPKDQPFLEPFVDRQLVEHGEAWIERYVAGGALERLDVVTVEGTRGLVARGAAGSVPDRNRAMAIVSLGAWCVARGL